MKKKVLSLCFVLCIGLSIPSHAMIGSYSSDTGTHNAHIGGGSAAPMMVYVLNNNNELWSLQLSRDGTFTKNKVLDGVKEIAAGTGSYSSITVLTTDGRLVKLDGSAYTETVVATDAKSLVSEFISVYNSGISSITGYYLNNKNELCHWNGSTTTVIDTNVREGTSSSSSQFSELYYIKHDNTLWKLNVLNKDKAPEKELLLEDVEWFAKWRRSGERYDTYFAIRTDGSLWGWGNTSYGDLGVSKFSTMTVAASGGGGIQISRVGVHCYVENPVKILDGIDKLFRTIYGRKEDGYELNSYNAVMSDGTVISWGGELYETNPNSWNHVCKTEMQCLTDVEQIINYSSSSPFQLVQYKDGRLTLSVIGGLSVWQYGQTYTSTARTVTLDMALQGYVDDLVSIPDNPSSWAVEQVNAAIAAGIVPEVLQSKYTQATTRAEFCALAVALYETATGKTITERKTFDDTKDVNIEKASAIGVVSGVGDNKFSPNAKLTREQAATMLSRLADAIGKPLTAQAPTFADNSNISSWAFDAVGQMQAMGIMGGVGNNSFSPSTDYTREQSIITIMRLYDIVK